MIESKIERNLDEGVDYDEEDEGGINVTFVGGKADKNNDDGYKFSEADNGRVSGLSFPTRISRSLYFNSK